MTARIFKSFVIGPASIQFSTMHPQYLPVRAFVRRPIAGKQIIGGKKFLPSVLTAWILIALSGCGSAERVAVIEGMSMAPHLYGVHTSLVCDDCRFRSVLRGDYPIKNPVCPNCGAANSSEKLERRAAPVVKVRELTKQPERWNIYAFSVPQPSGEKRITVKRLVAMPNEEIGISEGDLWVDGKRLEKNWDEQRRVAVLVRDFQFLPREDSGNFVLPWELQGKQVAWTITAEGIRYQPTNSTEKPARIEYLNWAGYHTGQSRFSPLPVMNAQPFDPLEAGSLTPVHDLLIEAEIDSADSDFRLEWRLFSEPLTVEFLGSDQKLLIRTGKSVLHSSTWSPLPRGSLIGCSTFDRCLTIAINDKPFLQIPIPLTPTEDREILSRPFALEGLATPLQLKGLKLYRDVYYVDRSANGASEAENKRYKLETQEYFFLGDNPVDSIDSRDWNRPGLHLKQIIGSVSGPSMQ